MTVIAMQRTVLGIYTHAGQHNIRDVQHNTNAVIKHYSLQYA